jgi:hypothetical protein
VSHRRRGCGRMACAGVDRVTTGRGHVRRPVHPLLRADCRTRGSVRRRRSDCRVGPPPPVRAERCSRERRERRRATEPRSADTHHSSRAPFGRLAAAPTPPARCIGAACGAPSIEPVDLGRHSIARGGGNAARSVQPTEWPTVGNGGTRVPVRVSAFMRPRREAPGLPRQAGAIY